jgi:hypothetical protein
MTVKELLHKAPAPRGPAFCCAQRRRATAAGCFIRTWCAGQFDGNDLLGHSLVLLVILYAYTIFVLESPPPGPPFMPSLRKCCSTALASDEVAQGL